MSTPGDIAAFEKPLAQAAAALLKKGSLDNDNFVAELNAMRDALVEWGKPVPAEKAADVAAIDAALSFVSKHQR